MLGRVFIIPDVLHIPGFLICQGYRVFLKKWCIIDAWQGFKYSSGSKNATAVLNMPGLHNVLNKTSIRDIW